MNKDEERRIVAKCLRIHADTCENGDVDLEWRDDGVVDAGVMLFQFDRGIVAWRLTAESATEIPHKDIPVAFSQCLRLLADSVERGGVNIDTPIDVSIPWAGWCSDGLLRDCVIKVKEDEERITQCESS
jgi:hypothetical protein